jgi:hypothetical protein
VVLWCATNAPKHASKHGKFKNWFPCVVEEPCRVGSKTFGVQDASVVVAAYNIKVDTIALLQTSNADEKALFGASAKKVLSVVAFACVSPTVPNALLQHCCCKHPVTYHEDVNVCTIISIKTPESMKVCGSYCI